MKGKDHKKVLILLGFCASVVIIATVLSRSFSSGSFASDSGITIDPMGNKNDPARSDSGSFGVATESAVSDDDTAGGDNKYAVPNDDPAGGDNESAVSDDDPARGYNEPVMDPEVKAAFEKILNREYLDDFTDSGDFEIPRYQYAYIDEDEIPELLTGFGSFHTSGVFVFKYVPDKDEAVNLGDFSSFGVLRYVDHGNRIVSNYGGQGWFIDMISGIEDDKAVLIGSTTHGESREERLYEDGPNENGDTYYVYNTLYYAGYSFPKSVDGSHKDSYCGLFEGTGPDAVDSDCVEEDEYLVSEEEYKRIRQDLLGIADDSQLIVVRYNDMTGEVV